MTSYCLRESSPNKCRSITSSRKKLQPGAGGQQREETLVIQKKDIRTALWLKGVILGAGILAVTLFFVLDLDDYLTLTAIQNSQQYFQELYLAHPFLVPGAYFICYICIMALNLPGAAVMTLVAGALFGFWTGTLLVSFASTIGATIACAVARYLFRESVQKKFTNILIKMNKGITKEGPFYLFTLRLIPVFPFFVINLLMGLTKLSLLKFYWVSQLGMLPGTMVYINAGRELGKLNSLGDILSPSLFIAFTLLGLFPLMTKKIMEFAHKKDNN